MATAQSLREKISTPAVTQLVKYGGVGVVNTTIFYGTYAVLISLGVEYLLASAVGYILGALNSYMLNRHWTFEAADVSHTTQAPRFALVQGSAIAADLGLLYLLVHGAKLDKYLAQAIVTLLILAVTFGVNRLWTFAQET